MDAVDLAFAGIARQAELVRRREIGSLELTELCLERIERLDPSLNAFRCTFADAARAAAVEADRRVAAGESAPLLGVPVAFKDEVDLAGTVNAHGTVAFERAATRDAVQVRRLREAGAIVLGRTALPELGVLGFTETEAHGATRNPWRPSLTPGGSSGGSAAAVAAGLVGCASASDGLGSIRIPAAFTGLFGLKPQRGRISLAPLPSHWRGLTVAGCLSRRVADTALWLDVASGAAAGDAHAALAPDRPFAEIAREGPGRLRIAWTTSGPRALLPATLDDDVARVAEATAARLERLGHTVVARDPDWGRIADDVAVRYLRAVHEDVRDVPRPERLERRTRGFARLGRAVPEAMLERALAREAAHAHRLNRLFDDVDVLMMPATGTPAFEVGRWEGAGALRTLLGMSRALPYTGAWNHTGQPAASMPVGESAEGLPIGMQFVVAPHREDVLLRLGTQLETDVDWPARRPPIGRDR